MKRQLGIGAIVSLLCWLLAPAASQAARPAPAVDAIADGCQRNAAGTAFLLSPEWVYVHRDPGQQMASGVVRVAHVSKEDSPATHHSHDYVANLVVDPAYRDLLGGDPAARTGSFAPDPEESGRLHFEWESGVVPSFAWPTDGDRATLWGSWIWDCGHWQDGARVVGERTELHPLSALVVHRRAPLAPRRIETQTDVFLSSLGTRARAVEQCAILVKPISAAQFGPDYRQCVQDPARQVQPLAPSYAFYLPAPPRPSPGARLTYRVLTRVPGSGRELVRRRARGLRVTVFPGAGSPSRYGKSFLVGWSGPSRARPTPLRITLRSLLVKHGDPQLIGADPGPSPWNLYLDVNGYRRLLDDWVPGLRSVTDGRRLTVNRTIAINVPPGRGVSLLVQGRECDIPYGATLFGEVVPVVGPCPAATGPPKLAFTNDDPGTILDVYRSPAEALGRHVARSAPSVEFAGSGTISFGDGRQGADDYELTYTVSRG